MGTIAPGRLHDVSNAADFVALTETNFEILTAEIFKHEPTYVAGVPTITIGPPTTGSHVLDELWKDALGGVFKCAVAGTPGTWKQMLPAAVTADPLSGSMPTGYLILNVTQGMLKRHAGGYVWETQIGGSASGRIGFWGVTPVVQPAGARSGRGDAREHGRRNRRAHDLGSAHPGRGSGPARQVRGTG